MSKFTLEFSDAQDVIIARYGIDVLAIAFAAVSTAVSRAAVEVLLDEASRERERQLRPLADTFKDQVISKDPPVVDPPIDATPVDGA